jgi:splicing factor 3B subunit 3
MHLYNLTLQTPTVSHQSIVGNFSGARQQEIIVSHGTSLRLLRPDIQTGKLSTIIATDVFGSIRSLASFRLTGGTKGKPLWTYAPSPLILFHSDFAIVGSDSGRIVILDYDPHTSTFVKVHQETFGKSGARRIVPGQYLATDPKGRAVMIAAMDKSKLVYILNRDAAANLTISSPLEAHRTNSVVHHIVGVDVGFENPMFAALEVDYTESDQDPTGQAAAKAGKVCGIIFLRPCVDHFIAVNLLRARFGSQSRRTKMERAHGSQGELPRSSPRRPARLLRAI